MWLSLCYSVLELINETWYFVALLTKCTMHCLFMAAATNGKGSAGSVKAQPVPVETLPVTSEFQHVDCVTFDRRRLQN